MMSLRSRRVAPVCRTRSSMDAANLVSRSNARAHSVAALPVQSRFLAAAIAVLDCSSALEVSRCREPMRSRLDPTAVRQGSRAGDRRHRVPPYRERAVEDSAGVHGSMNACTAIRAQAERNMWSKAPDLSTHSACHPQQMWTTRPAPSRSTEWSDAQWRPRWRLSREASRGAVCMRSRLGRSRVPLIRSATCAVARLSIRENRPDFAADCRAKDAVPGWPHQGKNMGKMHCVAFAVPHNGM